MSVRAWCVCVVVGVVVGLVGCDSDGDDPGVGCSALDDSDPGDSCVCTSDEPAALTVCSEASVDGLCCEFGPVCVCNGMACAVDESGLCYCGMREIALDETSTPVASCTAVASDEVCCRGEGGSIGASCTCGAIQCLPSEVQVTSCGVEDTLDCGSSERVSSCS